MPFTTTWTFLSDFQGWTFEDVSAAISANPCPGCSATRSHVPGAIRTTLVVASLPNVTAGGEHTSPTLNAAITNLDTIDVDYSATSDASNTLIRVTATYTDTTTETTSVTDSGAATLTLTLTQAKTLDFITILIARSTSGSAIGSTHFRDILEVRLTTAVKFGAGERPLELDVGLASGEKIWVTKWKSDDLYLDEYSSGLALQNTFLIATGTTSAEIDNKTFYLAPYAPPFFGTAGLDDIVYIFGRWDVSGTVQHMAKSVDGGATLTNIGDASWTTERVGSMSASDGGATIYAFLNSVSPALWRSIDGGASWAQINTLPFNVEYEAVFRHDGAAAEFIIGNNAAEAEMGAYLGIPYTDTWIGATGPAGQRLPVAADGGSNIASIIWI